MPLVFPHTGTVLSSMRLVTITFQDYAAAANVVAFGDALVRSQWYAAIAAEYGMSDATHAAAVTLGPAPASITRDQIAALVDELVANNPDVPKPTAVDNQVVYLLYVPPAVARSGGFARIAGYHEMLTVGGVRFPLAVVFDDGSGTAAITTQASHQLIDAATNPYIPPQDGYYADPPITDPWRFVRGEIADLCEGEDPFVEQGWSYARVYSSTAAAASQPPCKPELPHDAWSDVTAEPSQIQSIAANGSVKFVLTGWSTHPLPDWSVRVRAAESSQLSDDEMRPQLSSDVINNDVKITLTLHAPLEAHAGMIGAASVLSGDNQRPWVVAFIVK